MTDELLFVYGTLRRDTKNEMYRLLEHYAEFVAEGEYQGRLYRVDYYPGVVPSNNLAEKVKGEVYRLHKVEPVLTKLDQYEECGPGFAEPTEYVRERQLIELVDGERCHAWVYVYNHATDNLVRIASGDFLADAAGQDKSELS